MNLFSKKWRVDNGGRSLGEEEAMRDFEDLDLFR
jgi:hypothetical protein